MSWGKLDDRLDTHPKMLRVWLADPAAIGLWTFGLTYASRNCPGVVPVQAVALWLPDPERRAGLTGILEGAGLWERNGDGWTIHDFADYNPSEELRAKRAEAGRKGGLASGRRRRKGKQP